MEQNEEKKPLEEAAKWNLNEGSRKKKGKGGIIAVIVLILLLAGGAAAYFKVIKPADEYNAAAALLADGRYDDAAAAFEALGDYKDAAAQIGECLHQKTLAAVKDGDYSLAKETLERLGSTKDDVKEAVAEAFRKEVAKLDTAQIGELLDKLGSCIADEKSYQDTVRAKMDELVGKAEFDQALGLETAAAALRPDGMLNGIVEDKMKACMESGDFAGAKALLGKFGERIKSLAETVRYHVLTKLGEKDYDGTLAVIDAFAGTGLDFNAEKHNIGVTMINAGEYEKASEIFTSLGDYEDSREMLKEIEYRELNGRLIERMNEDTVLEPDEFAEFYQALQEIGDHGNSAANRQTLLHAWIDTTLSTNDAVPYLKALTETVKLSKEDKEDLLVYMLKNTPVMTEIKEDGTLWYCTVEEMKDYRALMDALFKDSKDIRAKGFLHYMEYLEKRLQPVLPSQKEMKALWDLRDDFYDFCSTGDPMLMFMCGRWVTAKDGEAIEVMLQDNGSFQLVYKLPTDEVNVYFEAADRGINSFDPHRMSPVTHEPLQYRVCDVQILDFNTIRLYNFYNQTMYILTRVSK